MRILLCDDDPMILVQMEKYLKEYFQKAHLRVPDIASYTSGDALLRSESTAEIAFLDVEIPGLSGIYTGEKLKKKNPSIKIFILTSYIRDTYSQKDKQQQRELNQKIAEALALDLLKTSEKIKEAYSSFDYVLVDRWTMCQEVYDKTWFVWNDFINECLALCYKPDIVFLISAEMDIVQRRLSSRPVVKETENIFSLKRVNRLYHNLAKENGWEVIENNKTLDDAVSKVYQKLLEEPSV